MFRSSHLVYSLVLMPLNYSFYLYFIFKTVDILLSSTELTYGVLVVGAFAYKKTTDCSVVHLCEATSYSHRGKPPTTIGAVELNFRVRYGNGCDLYAIITSLVHGCAGVCVVTWM